MIKHIIYRTTHKITGEFYIGLTKWDTTKPIKYWGTYWHHHPQSVKVNLVRETLAEYPDRVTARQAEPHWIEPHLGDPLCMNKEAKELKEEFDMCDKPGNRGMLGKKHTDETKKRQSLSKKGIAKDYLKGKPMSPSQIVTCPHCGKSGRARGMSCHHFDKCKEKPQLSIII